MTINKPKKRFFYGYRILLVTFLCLFFWAGLVQYSFSLYVLPLSEEFGWGRTAIMLAATLVAGLAGLCSPLVGRLLAAYGAKTVIAAGSIIMGIGFSLLALTQNLWQFYALFSFIGIGGAAMGVVSTSAVISNWFEKRRGWAIGILGMGIGAGGIFMPFLTGALLIPSFGWRISFLISGIVIALFITPLSLLIIKSRPEEIGLYPDGREPMEREGQTVPTTKTAEKSFTLRFALRTSSFWLMAVAFSLFTLTNMITFQSHAPYLQDHNFATAIVATAISIVGIGSTIAKFSFGWLCDYISAKYIFSLIEPKTSRGFFSCIRARTASLSVFWPRCRDTAKAQGNPRSFSR